MNVFLAGDVMTGRGIDQILPHAVDPRVYEPYVTDARSYVKLAEETNGPIPRPVEPQYIWGDALEELAAREVGLRIANLETSITRSDQHWPDKSIHYRMSLENAECLVAAGLDACTIANNHVLDWGVPGLAETRQSLRSRGIASCGAGPNVEEAGRPCVLAAGEGRVILAACGLQSSGIPVEWGATETESGVLLLDAGNRWAQGIARLERQVRSVRQAGDLVIVSVHWGGNWGFEIASSQRSLARALVDRVGAQVVFGHSSHHPKAIESYRGSVILYGAGDFINDYEGIRGHGEFRPDIAVMYLAEVDRSSGEPSVMGIRLVPFVRRRLSLQRATKDEARWLHEKLSPVRTPSTQGGGTLELADAELLFRPARR